MGIRETISGNEWRGVEYIKTDDVETLWDQKTSWVGLMRHSDGKHP